ncbi:TPA: RamA family antibiotic efflux transcriptional regulator [Klebsiella pneumoniae]
MNRVTFSVVAIMLLAAATTLPFVLNAGFGKAPQGAQLSQVEASPHYRDGQFHNQLPTPGFTGQKNMLAAWWDFLMTKRENARPAQPLPLVKTDLATLPLGQDVMVWLGHSSWYLQLAGKRILIDPVFSDYAAPFSFINKAFPGDYPWRAEGMPEIDLLIISHDHYDHLDYATIRALLPKIKRVITPLGVGSHLRYWGMDGALITEADWQQAVPASDELTVHVLPARHFSGRGLKRNQTLWASFLFVTPQQKIYYSGDSGYGPHFKAIGDEFGPVDLAIMENGQYDQDWKFSAQVIDTIVEWIDDNLHQPLRIDDIARHAGYSKWHLQRLFLQYKGESLGRYIRERKLLLAARDLRDTDQRIYDICLKYGFDSQQTFTRVFTRTFNQPPGAYRKENHSRAH